MFHVEVVHEGLNKRKVLTGKYPDIVHRKAEAQKAIWEEEWRRRVVAQKEREAKLARAHSERDARLAKKELAEERTREAQDALADLRATLQRSLEVDHVINWEELKDASPFPRSRPARPKLPPEPPQPTPPPKPSHTQPTCEGPALGLLDRLISSRRKRKVEEARLDYRRRFETSRERYERDIAQWEKCVATMPVKWQRELSAHRELVAAREAEYSRELRQWEEERLMFLQKQEEHNSALDRQKDEYALGSTEAVLEYCERVLTNSEYPDTFRQEFDIDYVPTSQTLIVDYSLPRIEDIPSLKGVKYVQSRDEFTESYLAERELNKLYDNLLYQIALRTVHELYDADVIMALSSVVFNGWVTSVDKATGNQVTACIMSLQTNREEFEQINLADVDAKTCFKNLKGVGSSTLHSLTPVPPVLTISREDPRFVSSYEVAGELDETSNLAAMDWEDFEHLIRELFEKEFTQAGGEVKVTQASRDGGVDAIAFDPDPIRGGKIVIQAKRYTNVVGVSAVRDLYGTVVNEGATKGILVTTADYGSDAYEFARGKPITLLNGANLLHLLEKHGHKARIDVKEARLIQAEREKRAEQS